MTTEQVQLERRAGQRFAFHLPVSIRLAGSGHEGCGFTQDLSARGIFLYTDFALAEGDSIDLTFVMPSEITLAESMRVRCWGKVMRLTCVESRYAVAAHLGGYEFLPEEEKLAEHSGSFARISALHRHHEEKPRQEVDSRGAAAR